MAVGFDKFDEEKERARLRKMSDEEWIREGRAARYMCSPATNFGKPPRLMFTSLRCDFVKKNIGAATQNNLPRMVK